MIVPIAQHKEGVLDKAYELKSRLADFKVKVDDSEKSPGWKFAEAEMRGIPVRIEIGPKDIEANQAVIVRRDNREKQVVSLDTLEESVANTLETMRRKCWSGQELIGTSHTYTAANYEEFKDIIANSQAL